MKKIALVVIFIVSVVLAHTTIKLPALVGNNMVLQRDAKINLWGWATPGEKINITFQNKTVKATTDKDGKWAVILPALPAGGPYNMVIKGKAESDTIRNILVGDVWLASGQSNMEFITKKVNNSKEEIEKANYSNIRLFGVNKNLSFQPEKYIKSDGWVECSPKSVEYFSVIAYLFGRELCEKYQVPIGLISSSWGGTPAEAWVSAEGLNQLDEFKESVKNISSLDANKFDVFIKTRDEWYKGAGAIDRGHMANGQSWADTGINTSDWSSMHLPGVWSENNQLKGYMGAIWFRKEIDIPANMVGKPLELNLASIAANDSTFFNGKFIGKGIGFGHKPIYKIPAEDVKAGKNLLVMRIQGFKLLSGVTGTDNEFFARNGNDRLELAGDWQYKTAADLENIPNIIGIERYNKSMPQCPLVLYNAMIAPLIPYTIKGVIWYQGESNADSFEEANQYYTLFPTLIKDWRKQWGYEFPFLFVQLAGYQPNKKEPTDYPWARVREAQSKALSLPSTGMATAVDIGEENDVHPKNKQDVAHRLVLAAGKVAYGKQVISSGPTFSKMTIEGDKIRISFNNVGSGLLTKGQYDYVRGFAIAGADKRFTWAKAYQDGNDIIVVSDKIKNPVAVRYDWCNFPDGNIYNKENLPATPFRTDIW